MLDSTPIQRIAGAWRDAVDDAARLPTLVARPLAIGWSTVDLDRATADLAATLGFEGDRFGPAPRSATLGGACRIATGVLPDGGSLLLLEPDTEGRLAESLARLDEGPVAAWLAVEMSGPAAIQESGLTLSTLRDGPFGPERLVVDGLTREPGRHRLLVDRAAGTIRP